MADFLLPSVGRYHGWRPDIPDARDYSLRAKIGPPKARAPTSPALKSEFYPVIRDQGDLGSCTGFATRWAVLYKLTERNKRIWAKRDLSPLYAYWRAREKIKAINEDSGAYLRDIVWATSKHGIPTEEAWPYDPAKFMETPPANATTNARWHQAVGYYRCDEGGRTQIIDNMLGALKAGLPIVFGFSCYANLGGADANGVVPDPSGALEGGHAVTICEADTASRLFKFANSWSDSWGDRGYGYLHFKWFENKWADDAWAVDVE